MSVLERCPSYGESKKGSKERQGPTLSVRFTSVCLIEVSVKRESTVMVSSLILLRSLCVYILKQLFFSISVNSGFRNIYLASSRLGKYLTAIHLDFKE